MKTRKKTAFVHIKIEEIQNFSEDKKKIFLSLCDQYSHINETIQYDYINPENNEKVLVSFNCSMVQKPSKTTDSKKQFYLYHSILGTGSYGAAYDGIGTLNIDNDNIWIKQITRCDFIYVSPSCECSMDAWLAEGKSKTAYVMLNNQSLFYVDKKTFFPHIALDFVVDLTKEKSQSLIQKHQIQKVEYGVQAKQLSYEDTLNFYSDYELSHKNYIIKMQDHEFNPYTIAIREADLSRQTPHLCKTKGPIFAYGLEVSFLKIDKKPGVTLDAIIEEDFITYAERIELTLALFSAYENQIFKAGIVSRDLWPKNIMVHLRSMTISFIDLGCAKNAAEVVNERVGNTFYASPERCKEMHTDDKSDSYSLAKIVAKLWGFECNHSTNLSVNNYAKDIMGRISSSNAEFIANPLSEDPGGILSRLQFILESMCTCDKNKRWDLAQGIKAFQEIPAVKQFISEYKYIVDQKTKNKITELSATKNFTLFSDASLRTVKNWQAITQCQNASLKQR